MVKLCNQSRTQEEVKTMSNLIHSTRARAAGAVGAVVLALTISVPAFATGPTYDITPITSSMTGELTSNLPIVLGIVGALFALTIAVRAVKKFAHV